MIRHLAMVSFAGLASLMIGAGCSSTPDDQLGTDEGAAVPSDPATLFDQAETCDRLFKRHESVRAVDMEEGVIRWACADVPGVTDSTTPGNGFGQEYCEYHAVQKGKLINKGTEIDTSDAAGKVSCVFTSVFQGAGQAARLAPAMADEANLGAAAQNQLVEMQVGFNSRGAATALFRDCRTQGLGAADLSARLRTAACYQEYSKGGANAAQLKQLCGTGPNVGGTAWTQAQTLGAKVLAAGEEGYDRQQDIAACMGVRQAGAPWRNSDPMICSRVGRTASECSCEFNPVPAELMGIPFTGWVNDAIPPSCRLAKVDNADYPYVAICDLSAKEVSDVQLNPKYSRSLVTYCHDKYSVDLVMKLPIRALQKNGTCHNNGSFCTEYMSSAPPPEAPVATDPVVSQEPNTRKASAGRGPAAN
jgi:hypothetical protein